MPSPRRLAAATLALVALTGSLVLAGSLAAQADNGLEFTAPGDGTTITWSDSGFTFTGTTTTGGDPEVTVFESDGETTVCVAPVDTDDGSWSCTSPAPLPLGGQSYIAFQSVPALDPPVVTDTVSLTVSPGAPSYDQPNPYVLAEGSTASFSGQTGATSAPTVDIVVSIDGFGDSCTDTGVATPGSWSCDLPLTGLAPGEYTMRVQQTGSGYWSESSGDLEVTAAVPFGITDPAAEDRLVWSADDEFAVSGTAPDASLPVAVLLDDDPLCTAVSSGTTWSCVELPFPAPGSHVVEAVRDGESQTAAFDVLLPAPDVDDDWPSTVPPGTATISFTGQVTYPGASTRSFLYEGYSEGQSSTPLPVTSCTTFGTTFECIADLSGLDEGYYTVDIFHFLAGDPSVEGAIASLVFRIGEGGPGETPVLGCVFAPASFELTDDGGAYAGLYTLVPGAGSYQLAPPALCGDNAGNQFPEGTVFDDTNYTGDWNALPPGLYELYVSYGGGEGTAFDFVFTIPETPVIAGTTSDGTTVTLSGSGTEGNDLRIDDAAGSPLCLTTVAEGAWSCTFPKSTASVAQATEIDAESRGMSAYSGAVTIPTQGSASTSTIRCSFTPGGLVATTTDPDVMLEYQAVEPGEGGSVSTFGSCSGRGGVQPATVPGYGPPVACSPTCDLSELAPGLHSLWFMRSDGDESGGAGTDTPGYEPYQFFFVVPQAPSITSVSAPGGTVTVGGTGTPGNTVRVLGGSGETLCIAVVESGGAWACGFPRGSVTTVRAVDIDAASGGMSSYSLAAAVPQPTPPVTPTIPPNPTAPNPTPTLPVPVGWTVSITGDLMNLQPGDRFTVTIGGMTAGWSAEVIMHSTPRVLGSAEATGGALTMDLTVPDDIESGAHRIEVVAITPLGTRYFENFDANVVGGVAPADPDEPTPTEEASGNEGAGSPGGGAAGDRSDPGAPSALSGSLAPLARIVANPVTIAVASGLALALLFLVALPTELLNSSLSSNTSRLGRVYGAVDAAMTKAQDWLIRVTRSRAIAAGILVVLVAVIYGFVDPGFGFDIVSLRLVLSLALAFFVLTYGAAWISGLIIRRAWGAAGVVAIQPSIILFAIVGVIVARILDFSPGFLVGVAIGLELISASRRVSARAVFVQLAVVTGISLAAWLVYSAFVPGADFAGMLVEDTLVAITAEGLTGALIAILPLTFLDGRELWEVSKRLWVVAFLTVALAFALLVLPTAVEGTEVGDYGVWLLVFAVFGGISLAIWLVFARAAKREERARAQRVDA